MTWLVLDVTNLAHRSFHVLGDLSHEGIKTGVLFGVLRDVLQLQRTFATDRIAWCFDLGESKRKQLYPSYKQHRQAQLAPDKKKALIELRHQIWRLRKEWLPKLGQTTIFVLDGFEADDLIASIVKSNLDESFVLVSSDHDLRQLLDGERIRIWSPTVKEIYTEANFRQDYCGLSPNRYAEIKSLAGCKSDGIAGVQGIGERTAAKFLVGKTISPLVQRRIADSLELRKHNLRLTALPFEGTPRIELTECSWDKAKWRALTDELNMKSLTGAV